jgi:DNA-binding XRE family transcriptional regulator
MSQLQLAKAAQVGEQTVIRLEKGAEANELTLYKLAKALEVSVHQLAHEEPPEKTLIDDAA